MRMWRIAWIATLLVAGCKVGSTQSETSLSVEKIEVSPSNASTVSGEENASIQYTATVYWNTGEVVEGAIVAWQSSNQVAGNISETGLFEPSPENGGVTLITASYLGISSSTTLTVVYVQDIVEDGLPESIVADADAASITVDESQAPFLLYPFDGVIVPRNMTFFEFLWEPAEDRPFTLLEFASTTTRTRVFTLSDRWMPSPDQWLRLAAANSGGSFTLSTYSGTLSGEGESQSLSSELVTSEQTIEVGISRLDAEGAIYYWSLAEENEEQDTNQENGDDGSGGPENQTEAQVGSIRRISYDASESTEFYAPRADVSTPDGVVENKQLCVSCHTISPSGKRMAVGYAQQIENTYVGLLSVEEGGGYNEVVGYDSAQDSARGSFSPDEKYVVGVDSGQMLLLDGQSWEYLYPVDLGFDAIATPSFSPDGTEVVFTVPEVLETDVRFHFGRIAAVPFDDGVFGEPYWVTPKVEGKNQYYPVYSPDGAWIAYNQSTEDLELDAYEGDAEMDLSAEIYLIAREGGTPIRLDKLNDVDLELLGDTSTNATASVFMPTGMEPTMVANSWPGWGPLPDAELFWLTFSSIRGFGHDVERGIPQIWIAAIDPAKAEMGLDPSSPPFWLPLQEADTSNHIPQWGAL